MKYWFSNIVFLVGIITQVSGQTNAKQSIHFEAGKASISLQQLDSIKQWTAATMKLSNPQILVHTYANDALADDTNPKLAGRRALLLQQCLEREGVPLQILHIESKVRHSMTEKGCDYCGELMVSTDSNFLYQNIYQELIQEYLMQASQVKKQSFWINPNTDATITTQEGVVIYIPKGSFATSSPNSIKIDLRFLKEKQDILFHALATRDNKNSFLDLERLLHLSATQNDIKIELAAQKKITIIAPSQKGNSQSKFYKKENTHWTENQANNQLLVGSFYAGESYWCNQVNPSALAGPNYPTPPSKPTYLDYDSIAPKQDEIIADCEFKLRYLNDLKTDEKGKETKLNAKQIQNEQQTKARLDRALITKEKIKIKARNTNQELEDAYYQNLAAYNKTRHQLQRAYLDRIKTLGKQQQLLAQKCDQYKEDLLTLEAEYGTVAFQKIQQLLSATNQQEKIGFWFKTNTLGWLSLGNQTEKTTSDLVPYRVLSDISSYQVTSFLIYDNNQHIVQGEAVDDTDIVFWEVPDNKAAKLLAITKEGNQFLIAWHDVVTNGKPIKLDFKPQSIKELWSTLQLN